MRTWPRYRVPETRLHRAVPARARAAASGPAGGREGAALTSEGDVLVAVSLVAAGLATSVTIANVDAERLAPFAASAAASAGVAVRMRGDRRPTALEFEAIAGG